MIVITDHQNIHYFILIHIFVPNFILLCSILEKGAQSFKVLLGDSNLNLDFQYGVQELGIAKAISHQHYKDSTTNNIGNCQGLSISQSLNLSLSLRDRADTIITLPHYTTTKNFLSTCTQIWYIIRIISSSPTDFHSKNKIN